MYGEFRMQRYTCQGAHCSDDQGAFFRAKPLVRNLQLFTQGLVSTFCYRGIEEG